MIDFFFALMTPRLWVFTTIFFKMTSSTNSTSPNSTLAPTEVLPDSTGEMEISTTAATKDFETSEIVIVSIFSG